MPRGGKREGAGAKPRTSSPTIVRGIRFTQEEWNKIIFCANLNSVTPSEFVRCKALGNIKPTRLIKATN